MSAKYIDRENDFLVLLEEEFGYNLYFWYPKMSALELEQWWTNLTSVDPFLFRTKLLPGDVILAESDEDIDHWYMLAEKGGYYSAHSFGDDESFLIRPSKEYIFHKGFNGQKPTPRSEK